MIQPELYKDLVAKHGVSPDTLLTKDQSEVILYDHSLVAAERLYLHLALETSYLFAENLGSPEVEASVKLELTRTYAKLEVLGEIIENSITNS